MTEHGNGNTEQPRNGNAQLARNAAPGNTTTDLPVPVPVPARGSAGNTDDLARWEQLRGPVRGIFWLGLAASVVGNILHAQHGVISACVAAVSPFALFLAMEMAARVPASRRARAIGRVTVTLALAGIAGWVSYWHLVGVASHYGEERVSAHLIPLSVDGLIVVAAITLAEIGAKIRACQDAAYAAQLAAERAAAAAGAEQERLAREQAAALLREQQAERDARERATREQVELERERLAQAAEEQRLEREQQRLDRERLALEQAERERIERDRVDATAGEQRRARRPRGDRNGNVVALDRDQRLVDQATLDRLKTMVFPKWQVSTPTVQEIADALGVARGRTPNAYRKALIRDSMVPATQGANPDTDEDYDRDAADLARTG